MHQILAYEWWGCTVQAFRRARRMAGWYESAQAPWEERIIEGPHWDAVLLLFSQQLSSATAVGRCHSRNPTTWGQTNQTVNLFTNPPPGKEDAEECNEDRVHKSYPS